MQRFNYHNKRWCCTKKFLPTSKKYLAGVMWLHHPLWYREQSHRYSMYMIADHTQGENAWLLVPMGIWVQSSIPGTFSYVTNYRSYTSHHTVEVRECSPEYLVTDCTTGIHISPVVCGYKKHSHG